MVHAEGSTIEHLEVFILHISLQKICFALLLIFSQTLIYGWASQSKNQMPKAIGEFRGRGAETLVHNVPGKEFTLDNFNVTEAAKRTYTANRNEAFNVTIIKTRSDASAFSLLTNIRAHLMAKSESTFKPQNIGTDAIGSINQLTFFKGPVLIHIESVSEEANTETITRLAQSLAETLSIGEGEVPPLLKHLPDWEKVQERAIYAVSPAVLAEAIGKRSVLEELNFEGGAEAITAEYTNESKLVIIEYTTPQFATYNDTRVSDHIKKLNTEDNREIPSLYKRIGNYLVFVFDAPDQKTAEHLASNIKYEQVVRWLGENPYLFERAQKIYAATISSVILNSLKATGLAVIVSLGIGGIVGAIMFFRRRSQYTTADIYTDAGGMTRLNIDNLGTETPSVKLLGKGDEG
jgi:hypothetical protein